MSKRNNPDLYDVYQLLKSKANRWDEIGKGLRVDFNFRQTLQDQGLMTSVGSKLENVLERWLTSYCSEPSWNNLIEVLRSIDGLNNIAENVKEYLLTNPEAKRKYNWTSTKPIIHNPPCHELDEDLVAECQKLISDCIHQPEYENAQGIMLIVGMLGVAGTANDVENVQKTFKELGFAVLTTPSPKSEKIACLIKAVAKPLAKYPLRYKYFAFYYSGHGGEDESGMFIRTLDVANSNPVLHIEKFIIKPLKELQLTRLFFFDCCQSPGSGEVFQSRGDIQKRPRPIAREVIAFATSGGQKALGGTKRGGVWTYHLCENLKKQDQPLVMVLAKTNGEVVKEREDMQKPYCENDIDEKLIISYVNKKDVCQSLEKFAEYWEDIALLLGIHDVQFRSTLENGQMSNQHRLEEVIKKWMKDSTCEITWKKVHEVVKELESIDGASGSTVPTKPVTKEDVFSCLKGRASSWNDLARELQIEDAFCSTLKSSTPYLKLDKVISKWIEEKKCVSWEKIEEVAKKLKFDDVTENVETFLKS